MSFSHIHPACFHIAINTYPERGKVGAVQHASLHLHMEGKPDWFGVKEPASFSSLLLSFPAAEAGFR